MAKRKKKEQQLKSYQESGADYLKRTGLNANQESGADYLSRTKTGTPWKQQTTTTAQDGLYGSAMSRINARMQQDRARDAAMANTKYWQQAAQDAAHSQNGDQSWQVYMAKQISDTPGGYDQWKAEQRRNSERETAKNRKLVQDMTYSGRHGTEDAYKLLQQGYSADQARQLIQRSDDIEDWYAKQTLRDRYKKLDADKKSGIYDWRDHPEVLDLTSWKTARGWINQQDYDINKTKQELATARQQEEGYKKFIEGRRTKSALAAAEERGGAPGNYAGELYDLLNNYDPEEPDEKHEQARNKALRNAEKALQEMNYGGVDFTKGDRNKVREYLYSMISGGKDTYADAEARLNAEGTEEATAKRRAELEAESEGERNITLRAARDTLDGMMSGNAPRRAQIGRGIRTDEDNEIARGYLYDSIMPDSYEERIAKYEAEGNQEGIRKLNDALDNAMTAQMTGQDVDEYAGAIFDLVNGGDIEQRMAGEEVPSAKKQQMDEILDRMIEMGPQRNMFYTQEYLADADDYLEEPEVMAAQKLNRATQDRIKELEAEERMLAKYNGYITKYSLGNNGQYKPENDRGLDNPWQSLSDQERGIQTTDVNRIYSFINGGKEWQAWATMYGTAEPQLTSEYDYAGMMNDTEIRIFNNFYNYGRYDEARQFLDGLKATGVLGARYREVESIRTQEAAKKMPVLSSIGAQAMTTVNTALGPAQALAGLMGSESVKDPNSNWYAPARQSEEIQNTIAQELGPYGQTYLVGMNSIRNVINGFITRGMGVTGKASQTAASLGVFASQIYQESTYKYLAETGDYNATRGLAALDAVMETAEELLPYEAMLSHYGGRPIIAYLANALSEAGEEFTGATVGDKIKGLITGRDSVEKRGDEIFAAGGYYDKKGQWVELDKSDTKKAVNEADAQALREKGEEIINNTLAGFAGGGLGALYSGITYSVDTYRQGQQIQNNQNTYDGQSGVERLVRMGTGMKEGTQSNRIANEVLDTVMNGKKPNRYKLGKLYQAMVEETGEAQRQVVRDTIMRDVKNQLKAEGVGDDEAEEYAGIITDSLVNGGKMSKSDKMTLAKDAGAIRVWQTYNTASMPMAATIEKINTNTAEQRSVMETLGDMMGGTEYEESGAADEVGKAVKETKNAADALDYLAKNNSNLMSEEYAELAKEAQENDKEAKKSKSYVDDVMKIRMAAFAYRETAPRTNLSQETAQKLFEAAQRENEELDKMRLQNNAKLTPGEGKADFDGAEYGTDEWKEKVSQFSKTVRNRMGAAAEIATRLGYTAHFINDESRPFVNGWQIGESGDIVFNVASGLKHHMLATAAHEMTHWLEHNSWEGYNQLRSFIVGSLRAKGINVEERLMQTIRNQDVIRVKEAEKGGKSTIPQLTLNDAMAELVAKSCENLLTSKEMKEALAKENPSLYNQVKTFVKDIIARIDNALEDWTDFSMSKEARELREERDQIAKLWLSARDEAQGKEYTEKELDEIASDVAETAEFSIQTLPNGQKYVEIDTDQKQFSKLKPSQYLPLARKVIMARFAQKGNNTYKLPDNTGTAIVNSDTANEYAFPSKRKGMTTAYKKVKGKASTEIDNLINASWRLKPGDPLYPNPSTGHTPKNMKYYAVLFRINGKKFYTGILNVQVKNSGQYLYDFSQIKEDTRLNGSNNATPATVQVANPPSVKANITQNKTNGKVQTSVSEMDEQYMRAVKNGDMETAQRMVEDAAEKAMPDSKIRLKNGKLRKLYHGTYSDMFTVFDPNLIGTAREGDVGFFGKGFYFAYTKGEASYYGRNVMEVYLNMVKPFNYQQNLQYMDGKRTTDYNASRAVFVTRFADMFPELANKHYVTVLEQGADTAKRLSLKEFGEIYKKTIRDQKFKIEKVNGEYGDEWLALSDKKTEKYTDREGKERSYTYYDFQQRYMNEEDARNQLTNAYLYLEKSVYDHIDIPNPTVIVMETELSQALQERGYDGVIQSEDGDEAVVFVSKQIKLADPVTYDKNNKPIPLSERFNKTEPDIRYSVAEIDDQYMRAVEEGDTEKQQEMVNAAAAKNSYNIRAYHGTGRADRVGTVFRPDRATSGPMAFFTDNREIAENYARDKKDTSIAYDEEYGDYYNQFRVKVKGKSVPVGKLWSTLSFAERQKITEAAKHITLDDEAEEIIYDENAQYGIGNFTDYERKLHGWNSIDTLIDGWLEGGTLWNREGDFLKVLELAGIKGVTWNNPDARVEKVYDTFLKILKPFDTSKEYTKTFTSGLRSWWANQNQEQFIRESEGADFWDKNSVTMEEWIDDAERDIKNGTTHNWTRIPDAVTAYLKEQGYDGIKDNGGKGGGAGHTVWIPFTSEQVKSADPVVRDDNGNVIPLSERFNPQKVDIRYSVEESPDMDVNRFMVGLNEASLNTVQEKTMLRQFKGLRTNIDLYEMAANENRREIRKLEDKQKKDGKLSAYDRNELSKHRNRLKNNEQRVEMLRRQLVKVTRDGGFAKLMYRQAGMMSRLVSGRTADEVNATVRAMNAELENVTKEMAERANRLKKLAEKEAVLRIRQQFNRAGLRKIATQLKSEMNSDLDVETIENRLALIALKMKQEQFDKENTTELADLLVGKMHKAYDSYVLDELRGRTIVLGKAAMAELKGQNRTLSDVRKELAGTGIRIASKGTGTLDQNWDELCDIIPGLDRNTNSGDQLDALLDVIRSEKRMTANEYGSDENMVQISAKILEAAQQLMPEIVTSEKNLSAIRETLKFVAEMSGEAREAAGAMDEVNQMIRNLQKKQTAAAEGTERLAGDIRDAIDYFNELGEQSEAAMWKSERVKLIEQLKSENTQNLLAEQAKWKAKIEKDQDARKKMESNLSLRRKITTNYSRIRKLLINETDQKNVPEHMKSLARYMLKLLTENDLTGRKITGIDKKDLLDTQRVLGAMDKIDDEFTMDDLLMITDEEAQAAVADALADLEDGIKFYNATPGKDLMSNLQAFSNALTRVQEAVSTISSVINAERSISFLDRREDVADVAESVRAGMRNSRFKGELKGRGSEILSKTKGEIVYNNMTPVYFFKNLLNNGMQLLWKDTEKSENRNGLETQKAQDYLGTLAERTGYRNWADQTHEVMLGGRKQKLTIENMMELYAIWKREQTTNPEMSQHLSKGGVFIQQNDQKEGKLRREISTQRAVRVTDEEIQKIYDTMTAEQKEYMDGIVSYLSNQMSDLGNEASMRMYGIKKYKESYYFPMKVWDGVKSARSDRGISGVDENRAAHKSWSKRRQHMAKNALVIGNFTEDAVRHIVEMINYNTMAPAIENMNKVLNYRFTEGEDADTETQRNLRVMFQEAYGREALRYLEDFMKALNGGVNGQERTLWDTLLSGFKKNAVSGSLSVAAQQPLSYIRAAMMVSPKYLAAALSPAYWKGSLAEMRKYSGLAVIKKMGRFDMNFGQSAKEYITPEKKVKGIVKAIDKTGDVITALPGLMDDMTWTRIWSAVKMEQHALNPGMDMKSDAFLEKVAERFNEVIRMTQVYDSVLAKSPNLRSTNPWKKTITSFMAEPTLSMNVLEDAWRNISTKGGKQQAIKALATFVLSAAAQAAVKGFFSTGRTPDKKKNKEENFLYRLTYNLMNEVNPLGLIPGYSSLVDTLKNGELTDNSMSVIAKAKEAITNLNKLVQGGEEMNWYRAIEDSIGQLLQIGTNIPAKNMMRDFRAMANFFSNGELSALTGQSYAKRGTSKNVLKYQALDLIHSEDLIGLINKELGDAGYKTDNKAYYQRLYEAQKAGNEEKEEDIKEYLQLGKGVSEETIQKQMNSMTKGDEDRTAEEKAEYLTENASQKTASDYVTAQLKSGEIDAVQARKLFGELYPEKSADDIWWKVDRIEYQKETGTKDTVSGYYYRLEDAVNANKADQINSAVQKLLKHGLTKEKIKDQLSKMYKSEWMAADSKGKVKIRDAVTKAYKAAGYTVADADKTFESWRKDAEKKNKKKDGSSSLPKAIGYRASTGMSDTKSSSKDTTGRYGKGNIDLNNRKTVKNKDGTISTEISMSFYDEDTGKEVLIPTVINGKIVSDEEAIDHYYRTGEYLGMFDTWQEAEEYAEMLHKRQDWYYNNR